MNNTISEILIIIGLVFDFFGILGLLRFPDVYNRLQSATKCVTLGTFCILLSLTVRFGFTDYGIKALLAIPFLFFTATIAAHALARGSYMFGIKLWDRSVVDEYKDAKKEEVVDKDIDIQNEE